MLLRSHVSVSGYGRHSYMLSIHVIVHHSFNLSPAYCAVMYASIGSYLVAAYTGDFSFMLRAVCCILCRDVNPWPYGLECSGLSIKYKAIHYCLKYGV